MRGRRSQREKQIVQEKKNETNQNTSERSRGIESEFAAGSKAESIADNSFFFRATFPTQVLLPPTKTVQFFPTVGRARVSLIRARFSFSVVGALRHPLPTVTTRGEFECRTTNASAGFLVFRVASRRKKKCAVFAERDRAHGDVTTSDSANTRTSSRWWLFGSNTTHGSLLAEAQEAKVCTLLRCTIWAACSSRRSSRYRPGAEGHPDPHFEVGGVLNSNSIRAAVCCPYCCQHAILLPPDRGHSDSASIFPTFF